MAQRCWQAATLLLALCASAVSLEVLLAEDGSSTLGDTGDAGIEAAQDVWDARLKKALDNPSHFKVPGLPSQLTFLNAQTSSVET